MEALFQRELLTLLMAAGGIDYSYIPITLNCCLQLKSKRKNLQNWFLSRSDTVPCTGIHYTSPRSRIAFQSLDPESDHRGERIVGQYCTYFRILSSTSLHF